MIESLGDIRDRVHKKSHTYFAFRYGRWDDTKRAMFYGATDALSDASLAAKSYATTPCAASSVNLLLCYGFLQAVYIQQDAVLTLSRALGLNWHPNSDERLREIRDVRNRLTGHPARAGEREKPPRLSSAIIPYHEIGMHGFRGHIYYEDGFEEVTIDVSSMLNENETRLSVQMLEIENHMDEREQDFRADQMIRPFFSAFGSGFDYLMQRLWCDLTDENRVPQAQAHASMIRERIEALRDELASRGFSQEAKSLDIVFGGIDLLEKVMSRESPSRSDQDEFDLIFDGLAKRVEEAKSSVSTLDASLSAAIGQPVARRVD